MKENKYPLLPKDTQETLSDALHYMKMAQLKNACKLLALPDAGKKMELIERIMKFVQTGAIQEVPKIPSISHAKKDAVQDFSPTAKMLYGLYKNDAATREFFKKLIGSQFHFTAFGIDWLNERWLAGNPPTYQEFADYWIAQTNWRKKNKPQPKDEWAFIKFMQRMNEEKPDASQGELMKAWKQLQAENTHNAEAILRTVVQFRNQNDF